MSKYFYELTEFPKIYKGSYWGNFHTIPDPEIIENRNRFIIDYNIKSRKKAPLYVYKQLWNIVTTFSDINLETKRKYEKDCGSQYDFLVDIIFREDQSHFDHKETYLTREGYYVFIYSPYLESSEKLEDLGFTRIYKLYSNSASTYMLMLPSRQVQ